MGGRVGGKQNRITEQQQKKTCRRKRNEAEIAVK
jgi:hypothetical protein